MTIFALGRPLIFPPAEFAEENGLLAIGGDLSPSRLLLAYSMGIFPWFSGGDPILWWSPDPRCVVTPNSLHISRSLAKRMRQGNALITFDRAFAAVTEACATAGGRNQAGGWLTPAMRSAYQVLHAQGFAHSVECWEDGALVGGLYGIALGRCFFGESMFHLQRDASKIVFVALATRLFAAGYALIDCQLPTAHLLSLGGQETSRRDFLRALGEAGIAPSTAPAAGDFPCSEVAAKDLLKGWRKLC